VLAAAGGAWLMSRPVFRTRAWEAEAVLEEQRRPGA
jgi:hypothetical protein